MQMANDRSDTMRARRLVGRPLVSVWLAALVMGCSANLPPMPTATAEGTATVAEATPAEATPAGGTQGPTTPAPSSFPSTSASPIPSQAASEWVVRDVPEYTTTGGADLTRTVEGRPATSMSSSPTSRKRGKASMTQASTSGRRMMGGRGASVSWSAACSRSSLRLVATYTSPMRRTPVAEGSACYDTTSTASVTRGRPSAA